MAQSSVFNTFNQQSAAPRLAEPTVIQAIVITDSKDIEICVSDTEDDSRDHIKNSINSTEHKSLNSKQKTKMSQNVNSNLNNKMPFNIVKQKEEYLDKQLIAACCYSLDDFLADPVSVSWKYAKKNTSCGRDRYHVFKYVQRKRLKALNHRQIIQLIQLLYNTINWLKYCVNTHAEDQEWLRHSFLNFKGQVEGDQQMLDELREQLHRAREEADNVLFCHICLTFRPQKALHCGYTFCNDCFVFEEIAMQQVHCLCCWKVIMGYVIIY